MKNPKFIPPKYTCHVCDYHTYSLKDFNKHLLTNKHRYRTNLNDIEQKNPTKYTCIHCNKCYQARNSLWYHQRKCVEKEKEDSDKTLIVKILQQNTELMQANVELRKEQSDIKEIILEIVKNGTHITNHHTIHTNSHNKAFNLNFFLNETCKNAMNISDFVESIHPQLSDLIGFGNIGYVQSISNIILQNLTALDETERPIHCTDQKRETIYVKDQGQWTKEDEKNTKLKKWINRVADKNIRLLPKFREKYPDYSDSSSKTSDIYNKMVVEVMETCNEKKDKIIKKISKAITIHK